jgi:23S rRNA pseudouridine2605 synthase
VLTNDGPLAHRLAHPRYGVEKVYDVEVEGEPTEAQLERLRTGVDLDDGRTAPARASRTGRNRLELALHEGRKHQVKRMCAAVGLPVTHLHRPRYAGIELGDLPVGEWRELSDDEVEQLHAATRTTR